MAPLQICSYKIVGRGRGNTPLQELVCIHEFSFDLLPFFFSFLNIAEAFPRKHKYLLLIVQKVATSLIRNMA